MTARAHVTLRIAAVLWIAAMALAPRATQTPKAAAEMPAAAAPAARHAAVVLPSSHGPAIATR